MDEYTHLLGWTGSALREVSAQAAGASQPRMLLCDSWLVTDGRVRELNSHLRRFARGVHHSEAGQINLLDFYTAVTQVLPREGLWFPRIELMQYAGDDYRLQVRVRPAPPISHTAKLISYPEPDPRRLPQFKGPDLPLQHQLRRWAQMRGADEAVLVDSRGYLLEGAMSAIVWWDGEDLVAPDLFGRGVASVTKRLVVMVAEAAGLRVRFENARPDDLAGCEVWSLSALHGIRAVTHWQVTAGGGQLPVLLTQRHRIWQRRLDQAAQTLP